MIFSVWMKLEYRPASGCAVSLAGIIHVGRLGTLWDWGLRGSKGSALPHIPTEHQEHQWNLGLCHLKTKHTTTTEHLDFYQVHLFAHSSKHIQSSWKDWTHHRVLVQEDLSYQPRLSAAALPLLKGGKEENIPAVFSISPLEENL